MKNYNRKNLGLLIKMCRTANNLTQAKLASMLKMGRAALNSIENGHSSPPLDRIISLNEVFGINLLDNQFILREEDGISEVEFKSLFENNEYKAPVNLGDQINAVANNSDPKNRCIDISSGKILVAVDHVEPHNETEFIKQYSEGKPLKALEKRFICIDKENMGEYLSWKVRGNAMADGTTNGFPDRSTVTSRKIKKELWTSKVYMSQWKYYLVVLLTGIKLREMTNLDTKNGIAYFRSLNMDKDYYPDCKIDLSECLGLYQVISKTFEVI